MSKKNKEEIVTYDIATQLLRYEPDTGKLFWKERPKEFFSTGGHGREHNWKTWNKRFSGTEAFTADNGEGYNSGRIFSKSFKAHRVIWLLYYKIWPETEIDHINGIRNDNRIENLYLSNDEHNAKNNFKRKDNKSGYAGVYFKKANNKWCAQIRSEKGVNKYLGLFDTAEEASYVREKAKIEYNYSERHGEERPNV